MTTTTERFWVVGGEYSSTTFHSLKDGGRPDVFGPYKTREEAREAWKRVSEQTRSCATAKYAITSERIELPR